MSGDCSTGASGNSRDLTTLQGRMGVGRSRGPIGRTVTGTSAALVVLVVRWGEGKPCAQDSVASRPARGAFRKVHEGEGVIEEEGWARLVGDRDAGGVGEALGVTQVEGAVCLDKVDGGERMKRGGVLGCERESAQVSGEWQEEGSANRIRVGGMLRDGGGLRGGGAGDGVGGGGAVWEWMRCAVQGGMGEEEVGWVAERGVQCCKGVGGERGKPRGYWRQRY